MSKLPVAFVIDDCFAMPAAVAITSILANKKPGVDYRFYLCVNGFSDENRAMMRSFEQSWPGTELRIVDVDLSAYESFYVQYDGHMGAGSITALGKFLLPQLAPEEDRLLYLDADIIVQDDISELFEQRLDGFVAGVVRDSGTMWNRSPVAAKLPFYFNSGVMLLNLELMRELGMSERLVAAKKSLADVKLVDQDAFNVAFEGLVRLLPIRYNSLLLNLNHFVGRFSMGQLNDFYAESLLDDGRPQRYSCLYDLYDHAKIIHFASKEKPWHYEDSRYGGMDFSELWMRFYRQSPCKGGLSRRPLDPEARPLPDAEIPLLIWADGDGLERACVTALSALENAAPDRRFDVHILMPPSPDAAGRAQAEALAGRFEGCRIQLHDMRGAFEGCGVDARRAADPALFKLRAPSLLPDCERAICLEAGVIVEGDLSQLFGVELGDMCLAGVRDVGLRPFEDDLGQGRRLYDLRTEDRPIDDGVLLMNLAALRDGGVEEDCLARVAAGATAAEALNGACRGRILALEYKYDCTLPAGEDAPSGRVLAFPEAELHEGNNRPQVIRYAGPQKPWRGADCALADRWWKYARQLQAGEPVATAPAATAPAAPAAPAAFPFDRAYLARSITARIDLKNKGAASNDLQMQGVSDPRASIVAPDWFAQAGRGYVLRSEAGRLDLQLRCVGDGVLHILLRSQNQKDAQGNHISTWIDYTGLALNGQRLFSDLRSACHDEPLRFTRKVQDGEVVLISLGWQAHDERRRNIGQERQEASGEQLQAARREAAELSAKVEAQADQLQSLQNSRTWKAGRALTWLPRKIKGLFRR